MAEHKPGYPLYFHSSTQWAVDDYDRIAQRLLNKLTQSFSLHQLPPDVNDFTGRQAEIGRMVEVLKQAIETRQTSTAIFVISGKAGVGKSTLAIHVAHRVKSAFADAQFYLNLRSTENQPFSAADALLQLLQAWDIETQAIPATVAERSQLLRSLMQGKRTVLVLDNAHDAAQVQPLIPLNSACMVLITSRQPLTHLEGATFLELQELSETQALEFLRKLGGVKVAQVTPEGRARVIQICDGLPLPIGLFASLLTNQPRLTPEDCVANLADVYQRQKQLHLSHPEVRASFALSYEALNVPAAQLLRLLGLLVEINVTPAIAAVLLETSIDTAKQAIQQLAALKFLKPVSKERYRLAHDLLRPLVRAQLAGEESPEARQATRLRISQWYLETAELMNWGLDDTLRLAIAQTANKKAKTAIAVAEYSLYQGALNWFESEKLNLLAAVDWAYQAEAWQLVLKLTENLVRFFDLRSNWQDWEKTHQLALAAAQRLGDPQQEAQVLGNWANTYARQQNWDKAQALYEQSVQIFRELADELREAQTLINLGVLYHQQNQPEATVSLWKAALTKLPSDSPEYSRIRQWMQAIDPLLLSRVAQGSSTPPASKGILQTISGALKRLISE
jgi:tetratricopeptide (TPR) repeat protein